MTSGASRTRCRSASRNGCSVRPGSASSGDDHVHHLGPPEAHAASVPGRPTPPRWMVQTGLPPGGALHQSGCWCHRVPAPSGSARQGRSTCRSSGPARRWRGMLAAAVVIGGGIAAVTPAAAAVADAAATNWKKVWKNDLKQFADKRYYTKKKSNKKYYTKDETSSMLGNYYTKAATDADLRPQGAELHQGRVGREVLHQGRGRTPKYALTRSTPGPYRWLDGDRRRASTSRTAIASVVTLSPPRRPRTTSTSAAVPRRLLGHRRGSPTRPAGHLCVFEATRRQRDHPRHRQRTVPPARCHPSAR